MSDPPRILDIEDNLERVREESNGDIDDELDAIEAQLAEYTDRTRADEEGVLDTVDNRLLRLETQSDGVVEKQIRAARNRIHLYRNARSEMVDDVSVIDVQTRDAGVEADRPTEDYVSVDVVSTDTDAGADDVTADEANADAVAVDDADTDADVDFVDADEETENRVEFWVVLANDGEERPVTVEIPFYRGDEELTRVRGESVRLGANEQETVTLTAEVPSGTEYYTVEIDTSEGGETTSSVSKR